MTTITSQEELNALQRQTILRSADGWAWQRDSNNGYWYTIASEDDGTPGDLAYPLTVLWEPDPPAAPPPPRQLLLFVGDRD